VLASGLLALAVFVASAASAAPTPMAALTGKLQAALALMGEGKCDGPALRAVADDPAFRDLPSEVKSLVYSSLVYCIGGESTDAWLKLATAEPGAPPLAWSLRFVEDTARNRYDDALVDLDTAVRIAKASYGSIELDRDDAVFYLWRKLRDDPARQRRLLADLDEANWRPANPLQDASVFWREYSLFLLQDGRVTDASRVAAKVTLPRELLLMRLDGQFDPLTRLHPENFDLTSAAEAFLERMQKAYGTATDDTPAYEIIDNLRLLGRWDEALRFADATLAKAELHDERGQDYRGWIEDRRAYVLSDLGRFDEAIAAERTAASRKEHAGPNVSNTINLAGMLNGAGRHSEALTVLKAFPDLPSLPAPKLVSEYGSMWIAAEQACAALPLGDSARAAEALAYTSAHQRENQAARAKALLCADDVEGAVQLYIAWLEQPRARAEALLELSRFAPVARPSFDTLIDQRFAKMRDDPRLREAVAKVGRTETLPLHGGVWMDFQ